MEITIIGIILSLSGVLFFIVRFMEFADHYSVISIGIEKHPPKCKKCHVQLSLVRNCKHANHSNLMPFVASMFLVFLCTGGIVYDDYAESLPPMEPTMIDEPPPEPFTWGNFWRDYIAPYLKV